MAVEPFAIRVPDDHIEDLRERLARTRWPGEIARSDWRYGTDLTYLKELCDYWAAGFDWRAREKHLNRLPQFRAQVDGLGIHFIHVKGKGPDPFPLILTHGWPSSVYELDKVIGPLSDPAAFGGDPADAFDVVVPSLPGYGFSDPPTEPGMSPRRIAALWAKLMSTLGYERYAAHGGDWGSFVTALLAYDHPDRTAGVHMTMLSITTPRPAQPRPDPEQAQRRTDADRLRGMETGYQAIQGTKPQTLAYGLTDSPAGLAGWIVEKWRAWSDCGGDVESRFTKDDLLTNISIYWFTNTIASSVRIYYEARADPVVLQEGEQIDVPAGFSMFRTGDRGRDRAEATFRNMQMWSAHPKGGHFAAFEEPDLLVADIRQVFRAVRPKQ